VPQALAQDVDRPHDTSSWLGHIFADGGYAGGKWRDVLKGHGDWTIAIIKRSDTEFNDRGTRSWTFPIHPNAMFRSCKHISI